ncbi:MAG: M28 family peptidase [Bacteriovoracaceae bacterium]|nr:M28 family peptidase [Bacteriovoracaceae bacterium]
MFKNLLPLTLILFFTQGTTYAFDYNINRKYDVTRAFLEVNERRIYGFIKDFSSYRTRFHESADGIRAAKDLYDSWCALTDHRSDIECELIPHKSTPQSSVAIHIKGSTDKHIILGGHLDSINTNSTDPNAPAPGAGDNASGIGVLNELINILMIKNYRPKHNISLYAYAAEEVGLLGSEDIASKAASNDKKILGVLQIDGANYKAGPKSIVLINDYTNYEQNKFLGMLIDNYLRVSWGYDKCGYACSDHYSWHRQGYKTSFPFESNLDVENPFIHTENDTLAVTSFSATHAALFTKLALSYLYEMDK